MQKFPDELPIAKDAKAGTLLENHALVAGLYHEVHATYKGLRTWTEEVVSACRAVEGAKQ